MRRTFLLATVRRSAVLLIGGVFLLGATQCDAQKIFHKKKKVNKSTSADNTAEPDKILYDKAMDDLKHGRHEVGRLNMQTLINTYPDSEYLAKAKLGIADSFYKEGGSANLTQAVQAYTDFGIFFPMLLPEAPYAQLQVAMTHYKQLEKPDRDRTQARAAEDAFQTFLAKYPNDPLAGKAEQHLREVQELLAEGDFRIGYYYYVKEDKKAAESRLRAIVNRYPLYSKSDRALWMLANIWDTTEKKEIANTYYARLVRNYPLSPLVPEAKNRLKAHGAPVPQPDPNAVAWMTAEQNAPRQKESLMKKPMGLVRSGPKQEMQSASRFGKPTMTPEAESETGIDVLTGGSLSRTGGAGTGIVATIVPGSTGGTTSGAENVAPATEAAEPNTGAQPDPNAATGSTGPNTAAATSDSANGTTAAAGTADTASKTDAAPGTTGQAADATKTDGATPLDATQNGNNGDNKKESTSKKKKGIKKIIPW